MNWKREWEFQRDQVHGMLPTREDWIGLGYSAVGTVLCIGLYCAVSVVIMGAINLIALLEA